jgi:hypothetical protein
VTHICKAKSKVTGVDRLVKYYAKNFPWYSYLTLNNSVSITSLEAEEG